MASKWRVKAYVVPLASCRTAVVSVSLGSLTPGFAAAMRGSFQEVISPRKMPEYARARELQHGYIGQVVSEHDATRSGRHKDHPVCGLGDLIVLHGGVAGSEIDCFAGLELVAKEAPDAFPAADGIVRNRNLWMSLLVGLEPLLVDGGRESGARALQ